MDAEQTRAEPLRRAVPLQVLERAPFLLRTPRGWRHFSLQIVLLGSFTFVYALTGLYGREHARAGIANARGLLGAERRLGVAWEQPLQSWMLRRPHVFEDVANYTYFNCQFTLSILFLLWAYFRRNDRFAPIRDAILAANLVSLIVLFAYPLAPPRMLPGFVDTLDANAVNLHSSFVDALNNPYSAMPSLHAAYAVVLGVSGMLLTRRWWTKLIWAFYPALVVYSVLATGNHFVLDVVAGAATLLATPLVSWAATWLAGVRLLRGAL